MANDELLRRVELAERLLVILKQVRSVWRELPSVADLQEFVGALDRVSDALQEAGEAAKSIPKVESSDIQRVLEYEKAFRQARKIAQLTPDITDGDIERVREYVKALSEVTQAAQRLPYREGLDG
jgi:hypothetical protein